VSKSIKDISWSFSALDQFERCPHQYYRQRVTKDCKQSDKSPALEHGNKVHTAMEDRIRSGVSLKADFQKFEPWAAQTEDLAAKLGADRYLELEMAYTTEYKPCAWFDKKAWLRVKSDVILASTEQGVAVNIDWKTGRYHGESSQLDLNAVAMFLRWPEIQKVSACYIFLEDSAGRVNKTFERAQLKDLMRPFLQVLQDVAHCHDVGEWPKKKNFSCRMFCPVKDCEFNG